MNYSKGNITGRTPRSRSLTVFIHHQDDRIEGRRRFTDLVEANDYFEKLCGIRSSEPASVVGVSGNSMKKYFRIDQRYILNRALLDLDWMSTE